MNTDDMTAQIMAAWEEIADEDEPEGSVVTEEQPEPEEPEESEEEQDDDAADDDAEQEDEDDSDGDEEEVAEAQEPEATPQYEDVEIQAFLGKYGGDIEKALKGGAELQRLMGRQGQEKADLGRRVEQLESELAQARALSAGGVLLNDEQQAWAEGAAESGNPTHYIQQALQAGEFSLARAVCREWANTAPFEAMRVGQMVDALEFQASQPAPPEPVPPETTWQALSNSYPELRTYEQQMVETLGRLGPEHPLVQEARSTDPAVAVRGIFGIYEIAKAATFSLAEQRNGIKQKRRKEADDEANGAVVTSASAAPSTSGTPRSKRLMPGLTVEEFDSAFDAELARQ